MGAERYAAALLISIVGCGGGDDQPSSSDPDAGDATPDTTTLPAATMLTGSLDGDSFTLGTAIVKWPDASDSRTWICATNVDVSWDECTTGDGPTRHQFVGALYVPATGESGWIPLNSGLYRTGSSPVSDIGEEATLDLLVHDPAGGRLALSMTMQFWDAGNHVTGTILIPK